MAALPSMSTTLVTPTDRVPLKVASDSSDGLLRTGALLLDLSAVKDSPAKFIRENYTRATFKIHVRDGVKLHTIVYMPKAQFQNSPILLTRTPYSVRPYGVDRYPDHLGPAASFALDGFVFAYQDVRGRWMSEGTFVNMRPEKDGRSRFDERSRGCGFPATPWWQAPCRSVGARGPKPPRS